MQDGQNVTLSSPVSEQRNGIILVWTAYYNGQPKDYDFNYIYISKIHITISGNSTNTYGVNSVLSSAQGRYMTSKYLVISDTVLYGDARNSADTNTKRYVLRYVYGY